MLQSLRKHAQGWIAAVIATILCLAFALFGIQYYLGSGHQQSNVAKVNGSEVTPEQWAAATKFLTRRLANNTGQNLLDPDAQKRIQQQALTQLIQQRVLYDAAVKAGFLLTDEQLGLIVASLPVFQLNGQFAPAMVQRYAEDLFGSLPAFFDDLRQKIIVAQMQFGISNSAFALPAETNQQLALANQTRDFNYTVISAGQLQATAKVPDEAIQAYYQKHSQEFMLPEQVRIAYLLLSPEALANKVTVTPQEIAQFYQDNKANFLDSKTNQVQPLAAVQAQIDKTLRQQKLEQLLASDSDQLANLTYTNPDTLKVASETLGLPVQASDYFTRQSGAKGLLAQPKIAQIAFSDNVLKQRNNSDLVTLDNQSALVMRIADYKPAVLRPLSEVKLQIVEKLKQQAAQTAAATLGEQLIQRLQQGANPATLASENHFTWRTVVQSNRVNLIVPAAILRVAFNLPAPAKTQLFSSGGAALINGDYVVVLINRVTNGKPAIAEASQRQKTTADLATQWGSLDYALYTKQAMQHANIKYDHPVNK